jgi:hypothetical protein
MNIFDQCESWYQANAQENRKKWVKKINDSLPQIKVIDDEHGNIIYRAENGIYNSESYNYVWKNIPSARIKKLLKEDAILDSVLIPFHYYQEHVQE